MQPHNRKMGHLLPTFSYSFTLQTERASSFPGHMSDILHEVLNYMESVELLQGLCLCTCGQARHPGRDEERHPTLTGPGCCGPSGKGRMGQGTRPEDHFCPQKTGSGSPRALPAVSGMRSSLPGHLSPSRLSSDPTSLTPERKTALRRHSSFTSALPTLSARSISSLSPPDGALSRLQPGLPSPSP